METGAGLANLQNSELVETVAMLRIVTGIAREF
jgi:hypothetical protein